MQEVYRLIEKAASSRANVLVLGESGTGKELVARALHFNSPRSAKRFVAVSCAALPQELLESELFGHEKGSFTGANWQRAGRFELADGGTLFLDEIGDITLATQTKLLRVLQEREFERVGGSKPVKVDVRLVAATNRDLPELIRKGTFREDLYYRLRVIEIPLPPLRDRREDVPLLVRHFIKEFATQNKKKIENVSEETMALLMRHDWPGNIRELENAIEHAVVMAEDDASLLTTDLLPFNIREGLPGPRGTLLPAEAPTIGSSHERCETDRKRVLEALEAHDWDVSKVVEALGGRAAGAVGESERRSKVAALK
jgi:transcriptional regulator with PAS, ATPase and Fis domain